MYRKEQLSKYPYFEEVFKSEDVSNVVDSLTGLISRRYLVEFIQHLVKNKVPFSLALLDLDNFKFINDTYGHGVGDGVLAGVAKDLERFLAGRYGGDEFLIVNLKDQSYDALKVFFGAMYSNYTVLRKNIDLGEYEPFVTGTIGCAVYPKDAQDYESLFDLIDKAVGNGARGANLLDNSDFRADFGIIVRIRMLAYKNKLQALRTACGSVRDNAGKILRLALGIIINRKFAFHLHILADIIFGRNHHIINL